MPRISSPTLITWSNRLGRVVRGGFAESLPSYLYFGIPPDAQFTNNPGTISYAGGSAPLVGSDIAVVQIVRTVALETLGDLSCLSCTLSFTTGPFAGTIPSDSGPAGYSFSGGGSLQIIGGANYSDGTPFLPAGTTLLIGVPTAASVLENIWGGTELGVDFQGVLHPSLLSYFGLSAGAFFEGLIRINMAEVGNPPDAFALTTTQTLIGSGSSDLSHVFVRKLP